MFQTPPRNFSHPTRRSYVGNHQNSEPQHGLMAPYDSARPESELRPPSPPSNRPVSILTDSVRDSRASEYSYMDTMLAGYHRETIYENTEDDKTAEDYEELVTPTVDMEVKGTRARVGRVRESTMTRAMTEDGDHIKSMECEMDMMINLPYSQAHAVPPTSILHNPSSTSPVRSNPGTHRSEDRHPMLAPAPEIISHPTPMHSPQILSGRQARHDDNIHPQPSLRPHVDRLIVPAALPTPPRTPQQSPMKSPMQTYQIPSLSSPATPVSPHLAAPPTAFTPPRSPFMSPTSRSSNRGSTASSQSAIGWDIMKEKNALMREGNEELLNGLSPRKPRQESGLRVGATPRDGVPSAIDFWKRFSTTVKMEESKGVNGSKDSTWLSDAQKRRNRIKFAIIASLVLTALAAAGIAVGVVLSKQGGSSSSSPSLCKRIPAGGGGLAAGSDGEGAC